VQVIEQNCSKIGALALLLFDEQPQWHEMPSSHALFAESSSSSVPTHALIAGLRQKHDDRLQIIDNLP